MPAARGGTNLPANLPAGWEHGAVSGTAGYAGPVLARTATPASLQLLAGLALLGLGFLLLVSTRGARFLASGARE